MAIIPLIGKIEGGRNSPSWWKGIVSAAVALGPDGMAEMTKRVLKHRLSRRRFSLGMLLAGLSSLVTACGGGTLMSKKERQATERVKGEIPTIAQTSIAVGLRFVPGKGYVLEVGFRRRDAESGEMILDSINWNQESEDVPVASGSFREWLKKHVDSRWHKEIDSYSPRQLAVLRILLQVAHGFEFIEVTYPHPSDDASVDKVSLIVHIKCGKKIKYLYLSVS